MMRRLRSGVCLAIGMAYLAGVGCSSPPPDDLGYVERIERERTAKDRQFTNPSQEPGIPSDQQGNYLPIPYYPIDIAYHVPARLEVAENADVVEIPTTTGLMRKTERIGTLEFTLRGERLALSAFAEPGSSSLFVPFSDLTSGEETYPAGRYLDIIPTPTGLYELDFNRAYHPYCYYNPTYDCPIPPRENRLPLAIEAGEKLSDVKRAELNPSD